jgi:hypothetical protein
LHLPGWVIGKKKPSAAAWKDYEEVDATWLLKSQQAAITTVAAYTI